MKFLIVWSALLTILPTYLVGQSTQSIKVAPLSTKVWVHTSYQNLNGEPFPSNGLVVEGDTSVLLVDTAWDSVQTTQLLQWVDSTLGKPVAGAVATHWHDDRTGGAGALAARKIPLYVSTQTYRQILQRGDILPISIFNQDTTFSIPGNSIEIVYPGPGHSVDNQIVWLPNQKILFGGCLVKSEQATSLGNVVDADLKQWPLTIGFILRTYDAARWVVPGHQNWNQAGTPGRNLLVHTLKLLRQAHVKDKP